MDAGAGGPDDMILGGCSGADLGVALDRIQGGAPTPGEGRAVAVAAGRFGAGRLASLDRSGRVIAYDGRPGWGPELAACPGGGVVAAAGRSEGGDGVTRMELTVRDATTLEVLREQVLPAPGSDVLALRCADRDGARVDLLVHDREDYRATTRLLVARTGVTREVDVGSLGSPVAVSDGFVGVTGRFEGSGDDARAVAPTVVHVGLDGARAPVGLASGLTGVSSLAVSPDGRTVAVAGSDDTRPVVVTLDARTGRRLGAREVSAGQLAWTSANQLLVPKYEYRKPPMPVLVFDRALRKVGERAGSGGYLFAAVGTGTVSFGGTRMVATPASGPPRVLDDYRLADATEIVGLAGASFAAGTPGDRQARLPTATRTPPTASSGLPGGAVVLLGAVVVAAAGAVVWRSRPRRAS